jgi:hypothetical protein
LLNPLKKKKLEELQITERLEISKAFQNDFISEIRGTVKILALKSTPDAQTQNSPLLRVRKYLATHLYYPLCYP